MISFVSFSLSAHSQNKKEPSSGADVVSSDTLGRMELMRIAIAEAREGIRAGHGGPFGTVIVKNGKIVGRGHNCVLSHTIRHVMERWLPYAMLARISKLSTSQDANYTPLANRATCAYVPACGQISVRFTMAALLKTIAS